MSVTSKLISKYTGNLCFYLATSTGHHLLEVDRKTRNVQHQTIANAVEGICYEKFENQKDSYLVSFGNHLLWKYSNNIIEPDYVDVSPYKLFTIINGEIGCYYAIDKINNKLIRFSINPFTLYWEFNLDTATGYNKCLIYRGGNRTLVYSDSDNVSVFRDNVNSCVRIGKTTIDGESTLNIVSCGQFNTEYAFVNPLMASGEELVQSSSSSSSFSSSSSSSISSASSSSSFSSFSSSSSESSSFSSFTSSSIDSSSSSKDSSSSSSSSIDSPSSSSSSIDSSSSSIDSSSSSSFGTTSSSSLGLDIPVYMFNIGWEHDNYAGLDYDYNDIYQDIYIFNNNLVKLPKMKLQYVATDAGGQDSFRIKSMSKEQATIRIVTRYGLNATSEGIKIYKNNVEQAAFVMSIGGANVTTDIVVQNEDEITLRLTSYYNPPNVLDIYQWQLFGADNRVRAKLLYYE